MIARRLCQLLLTTLLSGCLSPIFAFEELGQSREALAPYIPRQLPVGTRLTRRNPSDQEYTVTVAASDPDNYALRADDGCHYIYSDIPRTTYIERICPDSSLNRQREIFPKGKIPREIVLGTRYRYLFRSNGYSAVARCVAKAKVRVRLNEEVFNTYKLVCSSKDAVMTHYLSPDLGTYVAYVAKRKGQPRQIYEHVALTLPGSTPESVTE